MNLQCFIKEGAKLEGIPVSNLKGSENLKKNVEGFSKTRKVRRKKLFLICGDAEDRFLSNDFVFCQSNIDASYG